jgi:hypothetical protein
MEEILKCCGEKPLINDYTEALKDGDKSISLYKYKYMISCKTCGHHIHSDAKTLDTVIPIWNRSKTCYRLPRKAKWKP